MDRIEAFERKIWLDGPAEYLVSTVAELIAKEPTFAAVFGKDVYDYRRTDLAFRNLPALLVYTDGYETQSQTWDMDGTITLDVVFPAELRRGQLQRFPDMLAAAMTQQFRRPKFFNAVRTKVPALTRLGRTQNVDKTGVAVLPDEEKKEVPVLSIVCDFRIDLNKWDQWLEQDCRTTDDPFVRTLYELRRLIIETQAVKDDGTVEVTDTERFDLTFKGG